MESGKQRFTPREMMAIAAAREIRDGDIVFCGTGISLLAAMAAKQISAPLSIIFFETGSIDPLLLELPLSVADPRLMYRSSMNAGLAEAFSLLQNPKTGPKIVAILGAAQVDRYGNLNSTSIGPYRRPEVRFAGSGGASDAASFAGRILIFMKQEKRRFVEKLDYLTSPGWRPGPIGRSGAGLPEGGPAAVITEKGVFRFDEKSREIYLFRFYRGITPEEIQESTGFPLDLSRAAEEPPPTGKELRILREIVDPQRLLL